MTGKRLFLGGLIVVVLAGVVGASVYFRRTDDVEVTAERVQKRDLEAIVSASGKIQPALSVDISATTMGQVTRVAVREGERVKAGQFLLQIDPRTLETAVRRNEAAVLAARSGLEAARVAVDTAQASLDQARRDYQRQQDLWKDELTTREALEQAESAVRIRETELRAREQEVETREQQIAQETANLESTRYELTRVAHESPIDGLVTRRNIDEGETVVVGTMNNAGTVLLTIADMSVIQAEVEVDETDIPAVSIGQVADVSIDAIPDRIFTGHVTEIGNSPMQEGTGQAAGTQATNFKVVVVLDEDLPEGIRPGFTCTADITTSVRPRVLAVPIQAVTVRNLVYDEAGAIVRETEDRRRRRRRDEVRALTEDDLLPGQTLEETEGVFVYRDGTAAFEPVEVGIAGERFFEVVSGLREGDQVVTGPYNAVRQIADGDPVTLEDPDGDEGGRFRFGIRFGRR